MYNIKEIEENVDKICDSIKKSGGFFIDESNWVDADQNSIKAVIGHPNMEYHIIFQLGQDTDCLFMDYAYLNRVTNLVHINPDFKSKIIDIENPKLEESDVIEYNLSRPIFEDKICVCKKIDKSSINTLLDDKFIGKATHLLRKIKDMLKADGRLWYDDKWVESSNIDYLVAYADGTYGIMWLGGCNCWSNGIYYISYIGFDKIIVTKDNKNHFDGLLWEDEKLKIYNESAEPRLKIISIVKFHD